MWLRTGLWVFVVGVTANAQSSYELEYEVTGACPERQRFEQLVDYYLEEAELPLSGTRVRVTLREVAGAIRGSLELRRADGRHDTRELGAPVCEDAARALAFVLAYALAGNKVDGSSPRATPAAALPAPAVVPIAPPAPRPATTRERAARAPRATNWQFGLGVALGARTGLGPVWAPVEGALLELRRRPQGAWAPGLRGSLLRDETVTRIDRAGSTSFEWLAGRVDGCPLSLPLFEQLKLVPCVGLHLGRIVASGEPNQRSGGRGRRASELWLDVAAAARLELRLLSALSLEAQADVIFPLTPYRFAFDNPDTPVYQVPGIAGAAFVALAARFP